jgi:hypothetical protein
MDTEHERLSNDGAAWKRWGPYLAERAWGTVREDYSPDGSAWQHFPHDHARSRAYRWNEDGLLGICDDQQRLCFSLALWNERDAILKERMFGLSGPEGNHGEDVKEYYFYLDSTPTHSWMRALYKYPQAAFPYDELVAENRRRGYDAPEYELVDTGVFNEGRYFDLQISYAKVEPDDILIAIEVTNRGPAAAPLHLLPTLWFRNTWSWGATEQSVQHAKRNMQAGQTQSEGATTHYLAYAERSEDTPTEAAPAHDGDRPLLRIGGAGRISAEHTDLGSYSLACEGNPSLLFTENETNQERLYGINNRWPYVKDAFQRYLVEGRTDAVNPARSGTKAAAHYHKVLEPGATWTIRLRLSAGEGPDDPFADVETIMAQRQAEADAFYAALQPELLHSDEQLVQRQAFAGMLWTKQFYAYDVAIWLEGDPAQPKPPNERRRGRNYEWHHLNTNDIISMPDKWEYPWFAAWDLAFHCLPLALLDPEFAKDQLILMGREWLQHPNGQVPAYEWAFDDVNPPVLAWAAWRVYKIDQRRSGKSDYAFLERAFHKLLLNFTWWVNRKDTEGNNVFQGGFLGLDNIGVFDRSRPLPTGGHLEQADGTAWMGMFCLNMLTISLELARQNRAYEDIATKFFEHFLYIAEALNNIGGSGIALWNEQDEFFYDVLHTEDGRNTPLRIRSMVGLIPLFAVTTIEPDLLDELPEFRKRLEWFLENRPHLAALVSRWHEPGLGERRLLALCRGSRMKRVLRRMLDEHEFLGDYGVRALSRYHLEHPYVFYVNDNSYTVRYLPADSDSGLFGGNSNWRGPIWMPVNYLLIESLQQFHHYYGDDFKVECPTGSGNYTTLWKIADELSQRLMRLFLRDDQGRRAIFGGVNLFQDDPHWRDLLIFPEYFHGDNGAGIGASHQTGWTGLVAKLIQQQGQQRSGE